jgi:hypothetical protein
VQAVAVSCPEPVTVGDWRAPLFGRCVNGLMAIVCAACFATLFVTGIALTAAGSPAWLLASIAVAPVVYLLCRIAINVWRARLTITTAEVVVAGATRTHRVPLEQIDRFEPRVVHSGVGGNGTPMIVLRRHTADPIGVYALSRQGFVWNFKKIVRSLEPQASELNEILARARSSGTSPSGAVPNAGARGAQGIR